MFFRDLMIRTHNRTLQETPDVLYGVGINIATYPLVSTVVDRLVLGIFVLNAVVSRPIIGINRFGIRCGMRVNELVKRLSISVLDSLKHNITVSLHSPYSQCLVALETMSYIPFFTTYPRLVNFNRASKYIIPI